MSNLVQRVIDSFGPEDNEQYGFVQYLEIVALKHPIKFTSIPNSTWTKSIMVRVRNTLLGLRPGLCDMLIVYPGRWILFIEMKRLKGGVLSPEQKLWIEALSSVPNVEALRANGCIEATAILDSLLPSSHV